MSAALDPPIQRSVVHLNQEGILVIGLASAPGQESSVARFAAALETPRSRTVEQFVAEDAGRLRRRPQSRCSEKITAVRKQIAEHHPATTGLAVLLVCAEGAGNHALPAFEAEYEPLALRLAASTRRADGRGHMFRRYCPPTS